MQVHAEGHPDRAVGRKRVGRPIGNLADWRAVAVAAFNFASLARGERAGGIASAIKWVAAARLSRRESTERARPSALTGIGIDASRPFCILTNHLPGAPVWHGAARWPSNTASGAVSPSCVWNGAKNSKKSEDESDVSWHIPPQSAS